MIARARIVLLTICASTLIASDGGRSSDESKKRLEVESNHTMSFAAGGEILIRGSFGALEVEGWDRPEVEITLVKRTRKAYSLDEQEKALRFLNDIEVTTTAETPGRLLLETQFPDRSLTKRPLRGKTNVEMSYRIRAPKSVKLSIEHDVGEVSIKDISGDLKVTARIGSISLHVPQEESYAINARSRLGEIESDFPGYSKRKFLSQTFLTGQDGSVRQIYARVGIGEIKIRRVQAVAPARRVLRVAL